METETIHRFLFHPLAKEHSPLQTGLSIVTIIALSILTGGIFAITFIAINWQDRRIEKLKQTVAPTDPIADDSEKNIFPKAIESKTPLPLNNETEIVECGDVKVQNIKDQQLLYLKKFENWAKENKWAQIHSDHYDWWMFPVDRFSRGYGTKYQVGKAEIDALKSDKIFMKNYRRGVYLVVKAWGWSLKRGTAIHTKDPGQKWNGYGVRLAKMSDSLLLFEEYALHRKLQTFFNEFCLPQKDIVISNLSWITKSLNSRPEQKSL